MTSPHLLLNHRPIALDGCDPRQSLLRWLRQRGLTGTKEGCADGDCGACTVALLERGVEGERLVAVNSCLLPIGLLAGRELLTVEALASGDRLHPVQQALVDAAGSQCGYCTPGFVMSLFVGWHAGALDDTTTEGNLCRCTGYRPIRLATRALADRPQALDATLRQRFAPGPPPAPSPPLPRFAQPASLAEALALKAAQPAARWICGATDLGVELSHGRDADTGFIAIDRLPELHLLQVDPQSVTIGAAVPLARLERELQGVFPALDALLAVFAARQVRNRATLGGNLGTASPIGDLLPLLLALDAEVELVGADGSRTLPIDDYFTGYRSSRRHEDELIRAVRLPRRAARVVASKVAKRPTDDISIVAAVFALETDGDDRLARVRLAYGGVAAMPVRARRTEAMLLGRRLDPATVSEACGLLREEFTPLSDHRASADYRRALVANLFARFAAEPAP
jgi:xanthine dehydrogenase small subunit